MVRTVIAFPTEKMRTTIEDALERGGIQVHCACKSGSEVLRTIKKLGGGVVICAPRLCDMTADDLAYELSDIAFMLVAGRPADLDMCENESVFRISLPAPGAEICGSARILIELDERRSQAMRPVRPLEEKEIIKRAKELVMERNNISEEQAYRFLQKQSMETSTPLVEIAKIFLKELG